jgi:uncharacterized membrane protein
MRFINVLLYSPFGGSPALFIYSGVSRFPKLLSSQDGKPSFFDLTRILTRYNASHIPVVQKRPLSKIRNHSLMEDRTVMIKMAASTLAGLLFFITAMFTTMLDLTVLWRNIWLGFCLAFFLLAVGGVFMLCGDLNSEHSEPDEAKPKE